MAIHHNHRPVDLLRLIVRPNRVSFVGRSVGRGRSVVGGILSRFAVFIH
jgi:hypothetical protein